MAGLTGAGLGDDHLDVAEALDSMGDVYKHLERDAEALAVHDEVARIRRVARAAE